MKTHPKTIQIFLPSGNPNEFKIAEITTSRVKAIEFPRSLLSEFIKTEESNYVGIYLLFGEDEDTGSKSLYIGQSGDFEKRLISHNKTKDFWNRAVVITSITNNLTPTHSLFLENLAIKEAKEAKRYILTNGNGGQKPNVTLPLEAECFEIYEIATILLGSLGYSPFKPIIDRKIKKKEDIFYCKNNSCDAKGIFTDDGFVVLKGSIARYKLAPNLLGKSTEKIQKNLIDSNIVSIVDNKLIFNDDYLFKTPSGAANIIRGSSSNGWDLWINDKQETLNKIYRQNNNIEKED